MNRRRENSDRLYIRAGWLIDGSGGPARKNMILEVKDGYIQRIKPAEDPKSDPQNVLDLSPFTILPGLIDSHVHLFMSGTDEYPVRSMYVLFSTFVPPPALMRKNPSS